jgi:hypothetical protein
MEPDNDWDIIEIDWFGLHSLQVAKIATTLEHNPQGISDPRNPHKPPTPDPWNPLPFAGVGVLRGGGKGTFFVPGGYPCQSLATAACPRTEELIHFQNDSKPLL